MACLDLNSATLEDALAFLTNNDYGVFPRDTTCGCDFPEPALDTPCWSLLVVGCGDDDHITFQARDIGYAHIRLHDLDDCNDVAGIYNCGGGILPRCRYIHPMVSFTSINLTI